MFIKKNLLFLVEFIKKKIPYTFFAVKINFKAKIPLLIIYQF